MGMGNSFETITVLQYRLKAAQEELAAFQSGENISEWKNSTLHRCVPWNAELQKKKAWKQKEVKISGTKASLITVVFHSSFGENENELFIGHAGVLVPTKDKKLLLWKSCPFPCFIRC